MTNVIDFQNVSWKRQGETILHNIDWQVTSGQHWAILGLNGSGKTTLLNMVNGYIWPTAGTIRVLGKTFGKTDIRELRKAIGWVSSSLQERIRGTDLAEQIVISGKFASFGLYDQPVAEDYERAHQLMEQVGCSHLHGRTYQTCSQGEKQKLLIARGLMASPALLILDEPTNGLDFITREELLASIQQLAAQPDAPTILFVTHHIEEILPIFSHTLLLREGTIFDKGKTENLLSASTLSGFYRLPVEAKEQNGRMWLSLQEHIPNTN
ncbi:ABC transporter ATP-binding protein [Lentibacillus cibarius]|uniref:ABC transporter ATP-binding protein n=1 Tax=Lentibacillus cibarius TaxID=2583219 RepID=A0A5S3QMP7_9BACI|nr:ABC transporter ATP-binding protein [Lentibacillus cibarius]TMN23234.1 ABC transporter ATP-binding protein [Lentibacillus cibarius]